MKYLEFDTPAGKQAGEFASDFKLSNHGLVYLDKVFWNLPTEALYEEAIFRGEGHMTYGGPLLVNTGKWTAELLLINSSFTNQLQQIKYGGVYIIVLAVLKNFTVCSLAYRHFYKAKNFLCRIATSEPTLNTVCQSALLPIPLGKVYLHAICLLT